MAESKKPVSLDELKQILVDRELRVFYVGLALVVLGPILCVVAQSANPIGLSILGGVLMYVR